MPYTPKPPPRTSPEFQELYDYIEQELQSISREMLGSPELELRTTAREPVRPREGMIVQADGVEWDPGEGAGTYKYESGTWVRFGDADHVHTLTDITDAGALAAADSVVTGDISGVTSDRIIGRDTAGTGAAEQLTLSQVLDFVGSAARGDLLIRGASDWARLAIGTSGYVLKSDGTDPSWGLPGGWTELSSQSVTGTNVVDFADISQNHKALLILADRVDCNTAGTVVLQSATSNTFGTLHNGYYGGVSSSGTTFNGTGLTSSSSLVFFAADTVGTSYGAALIFDYTSTATHKFCLLFGGRNQATTTAAFTIGIIRTTDAITNLRLDGPANFNSPSNFKLIGLF